MEKRKARMMKKPNMALTPMEVKTPIGALQAAFWVSSDK